MGDVKSVIDDIGFIQRLLYGAKKSSRNEQFDESPKYQPAVVMQILFFFVETLFRLSAIVAATRCNLSNNFYASDPVFRHAHATLP